MMQNLHHLLLLKNFPLLPSTHAKGGQAQRSYTEVGAVTAEMIIFNIKAF
jgi:hypothetical protein